MLSHPLVFLIQTSIDSLQPPYHFHSNLFINNNSIIGSNNTNGYGATILTEWGVQWDIRNNIFVNNGQLSNALLSGGAMVLQAGNYQITNNWFIDNRASHGSVLRIRNLANVSFDSNFVYENNGLNSFSINSGTLNAFHNDFIDNLGTFCSTLLNCEAIDNYWGHPSGPRTASNPGGLGDSLPDGIPYIPFRTTPVFPELEVNNFGNGEISKLPTYIKIETVYPNPFNSELTIKYTLQIPQQVETLLFDINGREVQHFEPKWQTAGQHTLKLDVSGCASGVYILRLSTSNAIVS